MLMTLRRVLSEPWTKFQCRDLGFDRVVVRVPHRSWEHFNHCGLLHQSPHEQHCSRTKSYPNIDQNDSSWLWTWLSWHNTALHGTTCDLMRTKPEIHLTFLLVDSWDFPKKNKHKLQLNKACSPRLRGYFWFLSRNDKIATRSCGTHNC